MINTLLHWQKKHAVAFWVQESSLSFEREEDNAWFLESTTPGWHQTFLAKQLACAITNIIHQKQTVVDIVSSLVA